MTLIDFKTIFQNKFPQSFNFENHSVYTSSELGLIVNDERYVFSLQASASYETTESFEKKIWNALKEEGDYFLPIFLGGGEKSDFFAKTPEQTKQRVKNCEESTHNLYNVQKKVKLVSDEFENQIYVYSPLKNGGRIQILRSTPATAKTNFPTNGLDEPIGTHSSDKRFEESKLERTLHLDIIKTIELNELGLLGGSFVNVYEQQHQLNLF